MFSKKKQRFQRLNYIVELKDGTEMEEEHSMVATTATLCLPHEEVHRGKKQRGLNKVAKAGIG